MPSETKPEIPPFVLVYPFAEPVTRDGSNIFLGRLFRQFHADYKQIYWNGSKSSDENLIFLQDEACWPWRFGRGAWMRLLGRLGCLWWNHGELNGRLLTKAVNAQGFKPRFVYVVAYDETHAALTRKVLRVLRLPYVLHMMDLSYPEGLDQKTTPELFALASEASQLIAISPRMLDELRKCSSAPGVIAPCVSFLPVTAPRPFQSPFTIMISGAIYETSSADSPDLSRSLGQILPRLQHMKVPMRFVYLGAHFQKLPVALQKVFENAGFHEDVSPFCRQTHLNILPVHYARNGGFRYSLPSRKSDFLVSGAPLVCSCDAGTALDDFIIAHPHSGIFRVSSADELFALIEHLADDHAAWVEASKAATHLGGEELSIVAVRETIKSALAQF